MTTYHRRYPFHTILSYGNKVRRKTYFLPADTSFHTILSYGNLG